VEKEGEQVVIDSVVGDGWGWRWWDPNTITCFAIVGWIASSSSVESTSQSSFCYRRMFCY
jgi:hypothetical protein